MVEFNRNYWIRIHAANILIKIKQIYHKLFSIFIDLILVPYEYDSHKIVISCLKELDENSKQDIYLRHIFFNCYIRLIISYEEQEDAITAVNNFTYNSYLVDIADDLQQILQPQHLPQVVKSLTKYLGEKFYNSSSYRYEAVYNLIWHCAQNMTYQEFCQANE